MRNLTVFILLILQLQSLLGQSPVPLTCAEINDSKSCLNKNNCQWTDNKSQDQCLSLCQNYQQFNVCDANQNCSWVEQKAAYCSNSPKACASDLDQTNCNTQFCNYIPPVCSAKINFCPSFQSEEECLEPGCKWSDNPQCLYNEQKNACDTLIEQECASSSFCNFNQMCLKKPAQTNQSTNSSCADFKTENDCVNNHCSYSADKQLCEDIDCSSLNPQQCQDAADQCNYVETCSVKQADPCAEAKDSDSCGKDSYATFCQWSQGDCATQDKFCTKNCDTQFCNINTPSNCSVNPKSTACAGLGKVDCQSDIYAPFCFYTPIVPGFCSSKMLCSFFNNDQTSCLQNSLFCYFEKGGKCSDVPPASSSNIIAVTFISLFAILSLI